MLKATAQSTVALADWKWIASIALSLAFTVTAFVTPARAIGPYHIERTFPRVGQRGTSVEVTIQGAVIEMPREIIFYRPGIKAVEFKKLPDLPRRNLAHGAFIREQVRCRFEIAADCPLGEHAFRIRFDKELSSLGTFHVTPFTVIDHSQQAAGANDTIDNALAVKPNVTIHGRLGQASQGESDLFRVPVSSGQRLSVEVDSARIAHEHYGDSEFDLAVRILDATGRELAANDDNSLHLQDPMVSLILEHDGVVYVEVKRSVFAPRDTLYCLHIGTHRRPLAAYPPGGEIGSRQTIRLIGDPAGDYEEEIEIPGAAGWFDYFGDAPSPLSLRATPYPNVLEQATAQETRVTALPAALNGVIDAPGDVDRFRFTANQGQRLRFRTFAASLGSPIDARIRIRSLDAMGNAGDVELDQDDSPVRQHEIFGTSFRGGGGLKEAIDPTVVWTAKSTGDYLLEVSDSSGTGGASCVYRVEVEPPPDAIHTVLVSRANDWMECPRTSSLAIPQGNRWTVNVSLLAGLGNTYRGPLELVAHGLPQGVRLVSPRVPAGVSLWPVQFVADQSASPAAALITLAATAADPARKLESRSQQNVPFINHPGGDAWRTVRLDRFVLAVTEPAPFAVDVVTPRVPLVQGGELAIPVKITRRPGFDGPVQFRCDFRPPGLGIPPTETIPGGKTTAILRVSAQAAAPLGTTPLVIVASTVREDFSDYVGTGHMRVSSDIVHLSVVKPFVELASQPASVRRGESKPFVWTVRHESPFEGQARVNLLGLPKGVRVVEPRPVLTKQTKQITFQIEATAEALLGQIGDLSCEVIVTAGGQEIRQRSGKGTLRIDPEL